MKIYGHRGAAGTYPENTMDSFREAERMQVDGLELDIQLTKDDRIVVIHDETIDRTTNGRGFVNSYTYNQLKKFNANGKFPDKVEFCSIPLLEDVFTWSQGNNIMLNVELKNTFMPYHGMEELAISLTKQYGLEKRVIFSSFDRQSIVLCKKLAPTIQTALLLHNEMDYPGRYAKHLGASSVHLHHRFVTKRLIRECMSSGIKVRAYTVNTPEIAQQLAKDGCHGVITDYPDMVRQVINKN